MKREKKDDDNVKDASNEAQNGKQQLVDSRSKQKGEQVQKVSGFGRGVGLWSLAAALS